jgi:hypothetical protein
MKLKLIDLLLGILIPLAVVVTALLYLGARGPSVEVRDVQIHEIPTPPSGGNHMGKQSEPIAFHTP